MTAQQHRPEPALDVPAVARLRGIALLAAAQVHQRVDYHGSGTSSPYDSTASDEAVVASAVRFAQFLGDGR